MSIQVSSGFFLPANLYRPAGCKPKTILLILAGEQRNSAAYRDDAIPLGERVCGIIVAPRFDQSQFPNWQYQRGGIPARHGKIPAAYLIQPLITWAKNETGKPELPVILIGHSAGAQFLNRVAAYTQSDATATIIMNPSTYVLPTTAADAPYGFGSLNKSSTLLKRYLQARNTILLGDQDITDQHDMARTPQAMAQGPNRRARGEYTFRMAQESALHIGVPLGWQLKIVPHTGHDGHKMLGSKILLETVEAAVSSAFSQ